MPTDDPFVPMFVKEFRAPEPLPPACHVHYRARNGSRRPAT
ncbi:hypothetical protein [Micromonospora sp. b486]|nr:hypothetical protein [Micromonospora sp. b486]MDM4778134.1 hypothetical protein [Micromonospora sp. b486]